ncbi:Tfp pilus assembly protein FimT/FimU (plasmid) [Escherichia coli]
MKKEKGMTLLEVSLALIVTTSVMVTVWVSIQDMIRFYLTRTVAYTVINTMNIAIDTCKKQSGQSGQSGQCVITDGSLPKGNLTIKIKGPHIIGCLTLDGKINEDILKHMTSFYYVKKSGAKGDKHLSSLPIHPVEQPSDWCDKKQLEFYYRILK